MWTRFRTPGFRHLKFSETAHWIMGRLQGLQQTKERGVGEQDDPTRDEFEAAKRSEVSRLNVRVASMLGGLPTPEDLEVLWLDEPADEVRDKDIVRRWVAAKKRDP